MTPLQTFLWGFAGSIAVEVVAVVRHYEDGKLSLPRRYRRFGFYVARLLLAFIAGGLAVAYEVKMPFLAAHIGAATPLIIKALGEAIPAAARAHIETSET